MEENHSTTVAPEAGARQQDAELIKLCDEWWALENAFNRRAQDWIEAGKKGEDPGTDAVTSLIFDRQDKIEEQMAALQAHTLDGVVAKFRVGHRYEGEQWTDKLLTSVGTDLERLAGEVRS